MVVSTAFSQEILSGTALRGDPPLRVSHVSLFDTVDSTIEDSGCIAFPAFHKYAAATLQGIQLVSTHSRRKQLLAFQASIRGFKWRYSIL